MKRLHLGLSRGPVFLLLLALTIGEVTPVYSQSTATPPLSTFQIPLTELGYKESTLNSPHGTVEYSLRLPEGFELLPGSSFELDYSYTFNRIGIADTQLSSLPLGNITIAVDGQTQGVFLIDKAAVEHARVRVDLPLPLLNNPINRSHSIQVTLDADALCSVPHKATLIIHPTSILSLEYNQLPIVADLALYPRPFYQRAFEPDQVRLVLPAMPTAADLTAAAAVIAKLGDLSPGMVISGTTDQELLVRLGDAKATLHEHLILVGKPETNGVISKLSDLGVLPVPLRERTVSLSSEGPLEITPGGSLIYTLTLTNTTPNPLSPLFLVDTLPADTQLVTCSPTCSETVKGEVRWPIPALGANETSSFVLELRLNEAAPDSTIENTASLLDATHGPRNISTLTTAVSSTVTLESRQRSSAPSRYFFLQGSQAVPETDGIVQELVSPWDQTRAILVVTGLTDHAVQKASLAMSSQNRFPGMQGAWALVRNVRPLPATPSEPQPTDMTLADLGYDDKILKAYFDEVNYYLNIPIDWRLTDNAYLDLRFRHAERLLSDSSLNILFNSEPIATVAVTDQTALEGRLQVKIPVSQAGPRANNRISIQARLSPMDPCHHPDVWLLIKNTSLLHLDHQVQTVSALDLALYPYPFDQRRDLADVLLALPAEPTVGEWEDALRLVATLGNAAGGASLTPILIPGDSLPEEKRGDYHIIALGRPSRNALLQQVNAQLPQPFLPQSDLIQQRLDQVTFRLPPDTSLGYVQLIPSPWNEGRGFLSVTGTTDKGFQEALAILAYRPWMLKGNLALIRDGKVTTMDTRTLTQSGRAQAVASALPPMSPVFAATPAPTALLSGPTPSAYGVQKPPGESARPAWLIPLIGITGLTVLIILVTAYWQARRKRL